MELRDWLHKERISAAELARRVGIAGEYMRQIKRHAVVASLSLAYRIEIETGGEVTADEIRENYIPPH